MADMFSMQQPGMSAGSTFSTMPADQGMFGSFPAQTSVPMQPTPFGQAVQALPGAMGTALVNKAGQKGVDLAAQRAGLGENQQMPMPGAPALPGRAVPATPIPITAGNVKSARRPIKGSTSALAQLEELKKRGLV